MELVLQLAMLQKPATFELFNVSQSADPLLSLDAMTYAINAARVTGKAVLAFVITNATEHCTPGTREMLQVTGQLLAEFVKLHSLNEGELVIEMKTNIRNIEEPPETVYGKIIVICTDHPSQLSDAKSIKKPRR